MDFVIAAEPPDAADVLKLVATHLEFAHEASGADNSYALEAEALADPSVTFFTCRSTGDEHLLLGIGALKTLDAGHGEIKSMHTASAARGFGIAWAMLNHLADTAQARGMSRLSLETGSTEEFVPARALYESAGFEVCPPFGQYEENDVSICMTVAVSAPTLTPLDLGSSEAEKGSRLRP